MASAAKNNVLFCPQGHANVGHYVSCTTCGDTRLMGMWNPARNEIEREARMKFMEAQFKLEISRSRAFYLMRGILRHMLSLWRVWSIFVLLGFAMGWVARGINW